MLIQFSLKGESDDVSGLAWRRGGLNQGVTFVGEVCGPLAAGGAFLAAAGNLTSAYPL